MTTQNLLVELFVEELPPKALKKLGEAFANDIFGHLRKLDYLELDSCKTVYATPRRLAVHITNVRSVCPDIAVRTKLVPVNVGYDNNGNATSALTKRLEKEDATLKDLTRSFEDGKEFIFIERTAPGRALTDIFSAIVGASISNLPIPKVMTYQLHNNTQNPGWESVNFVRPAHGLVALHGSEIVPVSVLGLNAGNTTQGHRFEAAKPTITLNNADTYAEQLLNEGAVIASFEARRAEIVKQLSEKAAIEGLKPIDDEALLDEVTALVERPNVLLGQFETEFLEVPQECLILTMKANQKYFPLLDANGKLTNKFLIVSNINPADPSAVIGGNERVVRPRLADAKFFFDQDRKKTLASRLDGLNKVVYHNKLCSQGERNARVVEIATAIAAQLGEQGFVQKVAQAAKLSKTDLLTDMVGEFPELQGIMGRYYAQHEGLVDDVAFAIEDHYRPRFAGDALPRSQVGVVVALADKLEMLVGLFSIGEKPTGDKDPFALRRQALGIIRMLIEAELPLAFNALIGQTLAVFNAGNDVALAIQEFCFDRLAVNLRDAGNSPQAVDAVLSLTPNQLSEIPRRLDAVKTFASLSEAPALAAANKRVGNILKKVEAEVKAEVNANLLQEPAEKALNEALSQVKPKADKLFESGDYTASLQALAALKAPVDDFFDNVMVNADDPALKANRLGLLATLHQTMNRVADLSKLAS